MKTATHSFGVNWPKALIIINRNLLYDYFLSLKKLNKKPEKRA